MRNIHFLAAILLMAAPAPFVHAAECNYESNYIDSFTRERHMSTYWDEMTSGLGEIFSDVFAGSASELHVAGMIDGEDDYLALKIRIVFERDYEPSVASLRYAYVIPTNALAEIVMDDDSVVDLYTDRRYIGKTHTEWDMGNYDIETNVVALYTVDAKAREALSAQGAKAVRVTSTAGTHSFDVGSKSHGDIRQALRCLPADIPRINLDIGQPDPAASIAIKPRKCKYEVDERDKFTKVHTLESEWDRVTRLGGATFGGFSAYVAAQKRGDASQLWVQMRISEDHERKPHKYERDDALVVPQGAPLLVMMADQSLVELATDHERRFDASYNAPGSDGGSGNGHRTQIIASMVYPLDPETAAALTSQNVTRMRVATEGRHYDIDFSDKAFADVGHAIRCIQRDD